jgi:methionyl-tRNA formyltransferase
MTKSLSFIFMGTPDFAVPTLQYLVRAGVTPEVVVTQPDRPKGRGRKPLPSPVKIAALDLGCEVLQPASVSDPGFVSRLSDIRPDFFIVVAYGHLLTSELLSIPKIAPINLHASLLPKYRGAAPIQRAIMNGEDESGVTTMRMDRGMDTGDILLTEKTAIEPQDTSGSLHDRLAVMGGDLVLRTMEGMVSGRIAPIPQDHSQASYAPMLAKKDGHIDWSLPASRIFCNIRGVTPWPGAYTFHNEFRLKIHVSHAIPEPVHEPPGTVLKTFPDELRISTGNGVLQILEIQGASGKRMPVQEFLRGYRLNPGDRLS